MKTSIYSYILVKTVLIMITSGFIQSCGSSKSNRQTKTQNVKTKEPADSSKNTPEQDAYVVTSEMSVLDYLQSLQFYNQQMADQMAANQNETTGFTPEPLNQGNFDSSLVINETMQNETPEETSETDETQEMLPEDGQMESDNNSEQDAEQESEKEKEASYMLTKQECSMIFSTATVSALGQYAVCSLNTRSLEGLTQTYQFVSINSLCQQMKANGSLNMDPTALKLCQTIEALPNDQNSPLQELLGPQIPYQGFIQDLNMLCAKTDSTLQGVYFRQGNQRWACAQM